MPNYRRAFRPGGTFVLTIVTHRRRPLFGEPANVVRLRESLRAVMAERPFDIDAGVVLTDRLDVISRRFVAGDAVADVASGGEAPIAIENSPIVTGKSP